MKTALAVLLFAVPALAVELQVDPAHSTAAFAKPVARGGTPAETYTLRRPRTPLGPPQILPRKVPGSRRLLLIARPISYIMLTTKSS